MSKYAALSHQPACSAIGTGELVPKILYQEAVGHCSDEKSLTEALQLYHPGVMQSLFCSPASFLPFCLSWHGL